MHRFFRLLPAFLSLSFFPCLSAGAEPLRIQWIDVEGGAATLILTPAGESILVDTGMPGLRDPVRGGIDLYGTRRRPFHVLGMKARLKGAVRAVKEP